MTKMAAIRRREYTDAWMARMAAALADLGQVLVPEDEDARIAEMILARVPANLG